METSQRTIATEQTITFEGFALEEPKPFLLKFLTQLDIKPSSGPMMTDTWSTGPDDGADYVDC